MTATVVNFLQSLFTSIALFNANLVGYNRHARDTLVSNHDRIGPVPMEAYHVSLQTSGIHFCSGAILAPYYVVTAAVCVFGLKSRTVRKGLIQVVGGVDDLNQTACANARTTSAVAQIYLPMDNLEYSDFSKAGEIAILKLSQPMDAAVNADVAYLSLPSKSRNFVDKTAIVTGFSSDMKDSRLWFTKTSILNRTECSRFTRNKTTSNSFCAKRIASDGNEENRICCGDFGSPLFYRTKNKDTLVGITHNSPIKCDANEPCRFTNVTSFLPFIKSVINGKLKPTPITFVDA